MIDWLAIKQAADVDPFADNQGYTDNNIKLNPKAPKPEWMKQKEAIKRQDLKEKLTQVSASYGKAVLDDAKVGQNWKDAIESVGTQWTRGLHLMKPMAYSMVTQPIGQTGKLMTKAGETLGLTDPNEAAQQYKTWDWFMSPADKWTKEIREKYPYPERLENSEYAPVAHLLEDTIASAGLGTIAKAVAKTPALSKKIFQEAKRLRATAKRFNHHYNSDVVLDRARDVASDRWRYQQGHILPRSVKDIRQELGLPKDVKVRWTSGDYTPSPVNANYRAGWDPKTGKLTNQRVTNYFNRPIHDSKTSWFNRMFGRRRPLSQEMVLDDVARHEFGHAGVYNDPDAILQLVNRKDPGTFNVIRNLKALKNPTEFNTPYAEWLADLKAFGKNGQLSRYSLLRHHPAYLTYEIPFRKQALKNLGMTGLAAGTGASIAPVIKRELSNTKQQQPIHDNTFMTRNDDWLNDYLNTLRSTGATHEQKRDIGIPIGNNNPNLPTP